MAVRGKSKYVNENWRTSCHNGFPPRLGRPQKLNGVATDLLCTGVIGHPRHMFLNQRPKSLIKNDMTGLHNWIENLESGSSITYEEGLAPSQRPFENGTKQAYVVS